LLIPGKVIPGQSKTEKKPLRVPKNFIEDMGVSQRTTMSVLQYNASEINVALKMLKPKDAFCIIAVTNVDLYPQDDWQYCFGQAFPEAGTGVFSFARYSAPFEQVSEETCFRRTT
jgi:predicted Zn-dependent protease